MKVVAVLVAALAAVSAAPAAVLYPSATGPLVHAPRYDSAIIKSDRLGGNFAYSSLEAHAYAAVTPVIQNVISPVGVSYAATPIQYPAYPAYPAFAPAPAFVASAPVAAPIAPIAPIYPAVAPVALPAAPAAPAPEAPAPAPVADAPAPAPIPIPEDNVESSASSDDSITVEAA